MAGLVSIWHRPGSNPPELLDGTPALDEMWGGEEVRLTGAAFLQVNRSIAPLLGRVCYRTGRSDRRTAGDRRILRPWGARPPPGTSGGRRPSGSRWTRTPSLKRGASLPPVARFEEGPVEELLPMHLPRESGHPQSAPGRHRRGSRRRAAAAAARSFDLHLLRPPRHLARDLRYLASTLRLESIRCFDLFPQTAHVESVAVLGKGE